MDYQLHKVDIDDTNDEMWDKVYEFHHVMHDHINPEDPIEPDHIWRRNLLINLKNPELEAFVYLLLADDKVIGLFIYGWFSKESPNYEKNRGLAIVQIEIRPEYRRRGIGTELLIRAYDEIVKHDKEFVISDTVDPDGLAFNKRVGGHEALTSIENRLWFKDIDWNMVDQWIGDGENRNPNTKIRYFNTVPEEIIDHFAEVFTETLNQVPLGDLDIEQVVTPEQIRRQEKDRKAQDKELLYGITVEADGEISGMTWLAHNPHMETRLSQGLTSVREHHRGRGLGKWLKADILRKVQKKYPKTEFIDTGNATTNAPMLSINERLGFREHRKAYNLQIMMDELAEFVKSQSQVTNVA